MRHPWRNRFGIGPLFVSGSRRTPQPAAPAHLPATRRDWWAGARRVLLGLGAALVAGQVAGQVADQEKVAAEPAGTLAVELNKLEQQPAACVTYLVFRNQLSVTLTQLQLELVLFDTEDFILERFTLDAAPLAAGKTQVKLFEIPELECARVGRILINAVPLCASADGSIAECESRLALSAKGRVELFK